MKTAFLLLLGLLPGLTFAQDFRVVATDPADHTADVPLDATLEVTLNQSINLTASFPSGLPVELIVSPADSVHIGSFGINLTFTEVSIDVTHTPATRYVWILTGARSVSGDLIAPHVLTYTTGPAVEGFEVSGSVAGLVAVKRQDCIAAFPDRALVMLFAEPFSGDFQQVRAATTVSDAEGEYVIENVPPGTYWPVVLIDCNEDGVLEAEIGTGSGDTDIAWPYQFDGFAGESITVTDAHVTGVDFGVPIGGASENTELPGVAALLPNYPNPFNPQTTLAFRLDRPGTVRLAVYDVLGRRVAVLADGFFPTGSHEVVWDAAEQTSGAYLLRLESESWRLARPLLLLK